MGKFKKNKMLGSPGGPAQVKGTDPIDKPQKVEAKSKKFKKKDKSKFKFEQKMKRKKFKEKSQDDDSGDEFTLGNKLQAFFFVKKIFKIRVHYLLSWPSV
jgi:hypothetical protein